MRIGRTLPPTAAHIPWRNFLHGLAAVALKQRYLKKFARELKAYFGVRHVFLVSSGKAGLYITLQALQQLHGQKTRVIVPAYTCFSVPSAIVKAGLSVSLCDINPTTLDFDYDLLEQELTEETLCIIPNHLFGIPSDVQRVKDLCASRGIFVLEDAAQSMGERHKGSWLGTIGDAGVFSLGRGKNLSCGSGGIVITNSDAIGQAIAEQYSALLAPGLISNVIALLKACLLRLFLHPSLYWFPSNLRFLKLGETIFYRDFPVHRLHATGAALLKGWQHQLEALNRVRLRNADDFCHRLGWMASRNGSIPYLRLPFLTMDGEFRTRLYELCVRQGLGISMMYPTGIHEIEELKRQFAGMSFPSASSVASRLLAIPTHHLVNEEDKKAICALLEESRASQSFEAIGHRSAGEETSLQGWPNLHGARVALHGHPDWHSRPAG